MFWPLVPVHVDSKSHCLVIAVVGLHQLKSPKKPRLTWGSCSMVNSCQFPHPNQTAKLSSPFLLLCLNNTLAGEMWKCLQDSSLLCPTRSFSSQVQRHLPRTLKGRSPGLSLCLIRSVRIVWKCQLAVMKFSSATSTVRRLWTKLIWLRSWRTLWPKSGGRMVGSTRGGLYTTLSFAFSSISSAPGSFGNWSMILSFRISNGLSIISWRCTVLAN